MRFLGRPERRRRALLATLAFLAAACQLGRAPTSFDDADRRTEDALRALGRPMFEVLSFRSEGSEHQYVPDSFRRGTNQYLVHYVAEIRYTRDVTVPSRQETLARLREPDATGKEIERQITLRRLLGAGSHPSGSTQVLRNTAVFEEVESGWRFVAADGTVFEFVPSM